MAQPTGYTRTQIILHWLIFALIAAQFIFSDSISHAWRSVLKGEEVVFNPLIAQHVFTGIAILLLVVWRFAIKARRGAPALPEDEPPMLKLAANVTHIGLYLLMFLVPLSGLAAWFGGVEIAGAAHEILKSLLMLLFLLHVAGALYQQFVLKSDIMARMKRPS